MKLRTILTVMSLGLFAAGEARAEDRVDDLDLVKLLNVKVSTATKTVEDPETAPAVITVVTSEEIQRWGYRSVAEVLNHCVGFYIVDDHILPNVGVRGMSGGLGAESSVIKVMIDGRSVAYGTTSGNWLGVELIPMQSIKQIEIIRGPASALYGADAFLGVVNVITRTADDARPVRVRGSYGVAGTNPSGVVDATSSGRFGNWDYLVGVAGELGSRSGISIPKDSPGPTLPSFVGTRRAANNLDRQSLGLQARVGYSVPDRGHFIVSAYRSTMERGGDFAPWAQLTNATVGGREFGTIISLGQFRADVDGLLMIGSSLQLAAQAGYFAGGVLPSDRVEVGSELLYVRRRLSYRGARSTVELRFNPTRRWNAMAGFEGTLDRENFLAPERIDRETGVPVLTTGLRDRRIDLVNLGAYVGSTLVVLDPWLKLTGGLRFDQHSTYGEQLTGRVGATSRISKHLFAKLLYGSAFKAPSPYLLYASPLRPGDVEGNEKLKPQYIHTIEYSMGWTPSQFFSITTGVSWNQLLDKAEFTPQGINQTARNVARERTINWETRFDAKHYNDYRLYGSVELLHSERDLGQVGYAAQLLPTSNVVYPNVLLRAGTILDLPIFRQVPLEVGAEHIFVGPRHAADTSVIQRGSPYDLKPYYLLDAFLATREVYFAPGHETRFSLRARNILGSRGPMPGFTGFDYPLAPREVFLELQHTL